MANATIYGKTDRALPGQLGLLPGFEASAAHFFETPYRPIRDVLSWVSVHRPDVLMGADAFVEPCAGSGDIIRHVDRFASEYEFERPREWRAVEMRDERSAIARSVMATGVESVRIASPQRVERLASVARSHFMFGITNLPWYDNTHIVLGGFWQAFPKSWLLALLCSQYAKDGDRANFMNRHRPDVTLRFGYRLKFRRTAYPFAVDCHLWRPGGERGHGVTEYLTDETCPRLMRREPAPEACPQGPRETI